MNKVYMKKRFAVLFFCLFTIVSMYAKRTPPPEVENLLFHNYEFSVKYTNSHFSGKGVLVRKDLRTDTRKEFVIYEIIYNPLTELDVQFVFIKSMKLINTNEIEIQNERDEVYLYNIKTEKVSKGTK